MRMEGGYSDLIAQVWSLTEGIAMSTEHGGRHGHDCCEGKGKKEERLVSLHPCFD